MTVSSQITLNSSATSECRDVGAAADTADTSDIRLHLGLRRRLVEEPLRATQVDQERSRLAEQLDLHRGVEALGVLLVVELPVGAVLLEQHEEWQYGERRYLSDISMRRLTNHLRQDPEPTALTAA